MKVIERTWWRLLSVPDEGYYSNVPDEGYYSNVPDEGYYSNVPDEGYYSNVPDEGYWAYLMKVIECTWWRLFHKRVVRTKYDIYVFITRKW